MKWEISKRFAAKNKNCFRFKDVLAEFPDRNHSHLSKVLSSMVSMGMLGRIYRDLYYIIPLRADPDTYSPDSRVIARCMMKGEGYYIAYSSAMYIHDLSDKPETRTMVVTERQRQPSKLNIRGTTMQFVFHRWNRFFGYGEMWITQEDQVLVSDLEKTIVDAVTKPHLAGGIAGVGEAIYRSTERTDLQKLFYYLARNGSHAAKKRYLYLSHILGLEWTTEHEILLDECGASISLLDPEGPDQGRKNSRFGLKINIQESSLKKPLTFW